MQVGAGIGSKTPLTFAGADSLPCNPLAMARFNASCTLNGTTYTAADVEFVYAHDLDRDGHFEPSDKAGLESERKRIWRLRSGGAVGLLMLNASGVPANLTLAVQVLGLKMLTLTSSAVIKNATTTKVGNKTTVTAAVVQTNSTTVLNPLYNASEAGIAKDLLALAGITAALEVNYTQSTYSIVRKLPNVSYSAFYPNATDETVIFELALFGREYATRGERVTNQWRYDYVRQHNLSRATPAMGPEFGNTSVVIYGEEFKAEGLTEWEGRARFNDVEVDAVFISSGLLQVYAPPQFAVDRFHECTSLCGYRHHSTPFARDMVNDCVHRCVWAGGVVPFTTPDLGSAGAFYIKDAVCSKGPAMPGYNISRFDDQASKVGICLLPGVNGTYLKHNGTHWAANETATAAARVILGRRLADWQAAGDHLVSKEEHRRRLENTFGFGPEHYLGGTPDNKGFTKDQIQGAYTYSGGNPDAPAVKLTACGAGQKCPGEDKNKTNATAVVAIDESGNAVAESGLVYPFPKTSRDSLNGVNTSMEEVLVNFTCAVECPSVVETIVILNISNTTGGAVKTARKCDISNDMVNDYNQKPMDYNCERWPNVLLRCTDYTDEKQSLDQTVGPWVDKIGQTCKDLTDMECGVTANSLKPNRRGLSANDVCCVCGGGSRFNETLNPTGGAGNGTRRLMGWSYAGVESSQMDADGNVKHVFEHHTSKANRLANRRAHRRLAAMQFYAVAPNPNETFANSTLSCLATIFPEDGNQSNSLAFDRTQAGGTTGGGSFLEAFRAGLLWLNLEGRDDTLVTAGQMMRIETGDTLDLDQSGSVNLTEFVRWMSVDSGLANPTTQDKIRYALTAEIQLNGTISGVACNTTANCELHALWPFGSDSRGYRIAVEPNNLLNGLTNVCAKPFPPPLWIPRPNITLIMPLGTPPSALTLVIYDKNAGQVGKADGSSTEQYHPHVLPFAFQAGEEELLQRNYSVHFGVDSRTLCPKLRVTTTTGRVVSSLSYTGATEDGGLTGYGNLRCRAPPAMNGTMVLNSMAEVLMGTFENMTHKLPEGSMEGVHVWSDTFFDDGTRRDGKNSSRRLLAELAEQEEEEEEEDEPSTAEKMGLLCEGASCPHYRSEAARDERRQLNVEEFAWRRRYLRAVVDPGAGDFAKVSFLRLKREL